MQGKITKRAIDGLAATGGAEAFLWDTEVKGFGGRARKGGGKSYILHYRIGGGRAAALRKLTIGKHGSPWTPETARGEAKRLLGEVAVGRDPAKARQADRKALTFNELIDLYLAEGVSQKKASTLRVDRGRFEHHLRPLLGKLRIDRITRADVERMRDAVAAGKTAGKIEPGEKRRSGTLAKGGKGVAAQCVISVSAASRGHLCGRSSAFCPRRKSPGWRLRSAPRKSGPVTLSVVGDQAVAADRMSARRDRQPPLGAGRFRARMPAAS